MTLTTRHKNRLELTLKPDDCKGMIKIEVTQAADGVLHYSAMLPAGRITELTAWGSAALEFLSHLPTHGSFADVQEARAFALRRAVALFAEERADIDAEAVAKN
jgi:hypothetical protein